MDGTDPGVESTRSLVGTVVPILAAIGLVVASALVPALSLQELPDETKIDSGFDEGPGDGPGSGQDGGAQVNSEAGSGQGGGQLSGSEAGAASRSSDIIGGAGSTSDASGESITVGDSVSEALQNQSADRLFVVESEHPTYWRTGAYDRYTGEGWNRTDRARESTPYDGPLDSGDRTLRQWVTLETPARPLPAAWRPTTVSSNVAEDAVVTEQGAFRGNSSYPAGTSYVVTSAIPDRDPATLRAASAYYPTSIKTRYTQLPVDSPERLQRKADEITADADSPYEQAVAIETWLESNKEYSLTGTYEGEHVADHFVFEMERGYCAMFATAMVAMLRSQGVPARYVVGYSTGEEIAEDTYAVRKMNAHAWVEVYFPDVGWVQFDPTPGSERISREGESYGAQTDGDAEEYDHVEEGSPGEQFDASGPVDPEPPDEQETDRATEGGGLAVSGEAGASRDALRNQSTERLFEVQSERPAYWRTGAFDRYTGSDWARSDAASQTRPFEAPLASGDRRLRHFVTVERPTRTLPVAWRPRSLSDNVADDALVTGQDGLRSGEPLDAGESYTAVSVPPPRDPSVLRSAGTAYPAEIRDRYTRLPEETPDRLTEKTNEITADAGSPYEQAVAIESWLESNKEYSLGASYTGDQFADHFVFEMERGYCAMFATAMVAMLRSQGVPARYVVGYSTGEEVAEDTYAVRTMNAHAWVEVYFPDVGWVQFDPTPGSERLSEEGESYEAGTDGDAEEYDHVEEGSPGEQFDASGTGSDGSGGSGEGQDGSGDGQDGSESTEGDQKRYDDEADRSDSRPPLNVTVEGETVPGTEVVATVTRGGEPVRDARVYFNDKFAGLTNGSGQVTGEVPYADELEVSARVDSAPAIGGFYSGAGVTGSAFSVAQSQDNDTETYPLPTRINVVASGSEPLVPGSRVTLRMAIQGVPVADAVVRVDGNVVGRTNATGAIAVTVPWADSMTVVSRRGDAEGNESLAVASEIVVGVTNPVPGATAAGVATLGGQPIEDASVTVDGEEVATTDEQGQFAFDVPYESSVTIAVSRRSASGERTVDLPTNVVVEVIGSPLPSERFAVVATLGGAPVPDAVVTVEGDRVGRTDERGVLNVTMPWADPAEIGVRRGAAEGTATATPPPMNLSVAPSPVPVLAAGLPVSTSVTVAGRPVPGATVTVGDGRETTGEAGSAGLWLPVEDEAEVSAARGELTATTAYSGLFDPWLVLFGLLTIVGSVAGVSRRFDLDLRELLARARHVAARVAHVTAAFLVVAARRLDRALQEVARGLRAASRFVSDRLEVLVARLRALESRLRTIVARLRDSLPALPPLEELDEWLLAQYSRLRARVVRSLRASGAAGPTVDAVAETLGADGTATEDRLTVRRAWAEMVAQLPVRRYETRTPGELERLAVDRGFPAEPVSTLTDAFREVEYGRYDPDGGRLSRARAALERIRAFLDRDDGGERA